MSINNLVIFKGRSGAGEVMVSGIPAGTATISVFDITGAGLTNAFAPNAPASGVLLQIFTDDLSANTFIAIW